MNALSRLFGRLGSLLPLPRALDDEPPIVDPRVDPDALETYGRAQISQYGTAQGHAGGAPLPTHWAVEDAADAREAEHQRVSD